VTAADTPETTFRVVIEIELAADDTARFERLWLTIADEVAGVEGCRGQWLLRHRHRADTLVIMSDWLDEAAFHRFEQGPVHARHREFIRPIRTGGSFSAAYVLHHRPADVSA